MYFKKLILKYINYLYIYNDNIDFLYKKSIRSYFITLMAVVYCMILNISNYKLMYLCYFYIYEHVEYLDIYYNNETDYLNYLFFIFNWVYLFIKIDDYYFTSKLVVVISIIEFLIIKKK